MLNSSAERPIAVIDSGVGGISVLKELTVLLPEEDFLFFGDEANAPYGTKSRTDVCSITVNNVKKLIVDYNIKAVVIACNTATGASVGVLRNMYPEMPIIGIEPEIKTAAFSSEHPTVLIMATPLTLSQPKFLYLKNKYRKKADFRLLPCPGLMELIEEGHLNDKSLKDYLEKLFNSLRGNKFDAIVLGCTHYPHIKNSISEFFPGIPIYDGCRGTAAETRRRLEESGLAEHSGRTGTIHFLTTANNPNFFKICNTLLNM